MKNLTFDELEKFVLEHEAHLNVSVFFKDENEEKKEVCILNNGTKYSSYGVQIGMSNAESSAIHVVEIVENFGRKFYDKYVIKMYSDAFGISDLFKISY